MVNFLTLRKKIYLLSLFSGLFFVGIVWSGYSNLNHLLEYFEEFSYTSSFAKKNIGLAKDIEELRSSVQKFSYTGLEGEASQVKKLYKNIQESMKQNVPPSELSINENFTLMQTHLEKYMVTFIELEKQVLAQKQLRNDKKILNLQIENQLKKYLQSSHIKSQKQYHLQLLTSLHESEKNTLYFFDRLDNKYIKIIKKEQKNAIKKLLKLKELETEKSIKVDLDEIITAFKAYAKTNIKEIQQTRGYLFLVNVVMAAEAYEVLYQANQISDASEKILNEIDKDVNIKIQDLINTLSLTGFLSLLIMVIISLVITRSIVRPISSLTHAFVELANGNNEIDIPTYKVRDEIGGLTEAARIFRHKNEEVQELLEHSEKLSEKLSLSQERFTLALEGAQDGLWDWNLITDEVFYSDTWKSMFDYEGDEVGNTLQEWKDKIHPDDVSGVMAIFSNYLQNSTGTYESEMRIRCKGGEYKHVLARGNAISDENGYVIRMIGLHIDITEQKNLEKSLVKAKEAADNANKSKSDFLANMSHEIRTPLNGILGLNDLVLKTDLDEKQRGYLLKSKTSSQALLHVINDILDYSKIEAGKLNLEMKSFDLETVLRNIMDLFEYQANNKGISLSQTNSANLYGHRLIGDALRLTQILTNLVGNAIKFTEQGNVQISVNISSEEEDFINLEFKVKDSGIGMSKEVQENLFKEFTQADTSITRKYGGTGLGLTISKQLVKMMEGEIWTESIEGEGSSFIFNIKFEKSKEETSTTEEVISDILSPRHMNALEGIKILLVEDNKVNQLVAMGLLEDYKVDIDIANNGQEAVDMASAEIYDVILMDLQMPVMDGFEATKIIRTYTDYTSTPIFALSAAVMQEDKKLTKEAGMDEHLAKPIDKEVLIETLVAYVS